MLVSALGLSLSVGTNVAAGKASASSPKEQELRCMQQLQQIGKALNAYRDERHQFPPRLEALYPKYLADREAFHCPCLRAQITAHGGDWDSLRQKSFLTYTYYYEFAGKQSKIPKPNHAGPAENYLSWDQAVRIRGKLMPVIACDLHSPRSQDNGKGEGSFAGFVRPQVCLVLRMDGSVTKTTMKQALQTLPREHAPRNAFFWWMW
jgi:hypothetical protein